MKDEMTLMSETISRLAELGKTRRSRLLAQAKPCPNPECGHSNLEFKSSKGAKWIVCIDCDFSGLKGTDGDEALEFWNALVREEKDTAAISYTVE